MFNCTKIVAPLPSVINFYYYFSYFILFLTLLITPIQFYVILTKSKNLHSFKWLILNHSFWCFCFEISWTTVKPFFLGPSTCGFSMGFLRYTNPKLTALSMSIMIAFIASMTISLTATLLNRYLAAFPLNAAHQYLLKIGSLLIIFCGIVSYAGDFVSFYPLFSKYPEEMFQEAIDYDPCLKYYFLTEPGFLFAPYEGIKFYAHILFLFFLILIVFAILFFIYFIFLIKTTQKTQTFAKLQHALTLSATIQLSISIIFICIPILILTGIASFQIPNTQNIFIILFCVMSTHTFLESITTLYFVIPYRKFIKEMFKKVLSYFRESSKNYNNTIKIVELSILYFGLSCN